MPDYRLDLASLVDPTDPGAHGLGTVIVSDVLGQTGVPESEDPPLTFSKVGNGAWAISFALPIDDPLVTRANFALGQRELHLYRDGVLVWGGRLWGATIPHIAAVRFMGQGWYSTLRRREITEKKLYLATDPATGSPVIGSDQVNIAWDLISYTQGKPGGNLGITRTGTDASNATGIRRHAAYCSWELVKVSDAIDTLAQAEGGFDFEISPAKVWRTWYPSRGVDRTASVVIDASVNASELTYDEDAYEQTVSEFRGLGPCRTCDGDTDVKISQNAPALAKFGLLQDSERWEVKDPDHLQALTSEQLRLRKDTTSTHRLVVPSELGGPVWGIDYDVGDTVKVQATNGWATFGEGHRVNSISVDVQPGGVETVTLEVAPA